MVIAVFQKIIAHIWAFQVALGITLYVHCKSKHVPAFLKMWENYKLQHGGLTLSFMRQFAFKRIIWANVFFLVMYTIHGILLLIYTPELYIKMQFPLLKYYSTIEQNHVLLFFYTCFYVYTSLAWLQSALYITCYCSLFKFEFRKLATEFADEIHNKDEQRASIKRMHYAKSSESIDGRKLLVHQPSSLKKYTFESEQYRQRYFDLCKLVRRLDDIMSAYLLSFYLCCVPEIILLMYGVLDSAHHHEDDFSLVVGVVSLVYFVALLISITGAASGVAASVSLLSNHYNKGYSFTKRKKINK